MSTRRSFRDEADRTWQVSINVPIVKRIREFAGLDLLEVLDDTGMLARLVADPVLLVDVLWLVCQDEARAREIDEEEFGRSLAGDAIDQATGAFLEALTDFFPRGRREILRKATAKIEEVQARTIAKLDKILQGDDLDRAIEARLTAAEEEIKARLHSSRPTSPTTTETQTQTPAPATGGGSSIA